MSYRVAIVCMESNGKKYPFNLAEGVLLGDEDYGGNPIGAEVIVRFVGKTANKISVGKIVDVVARRKACVNNVVSVKGYAYKSRGPMSVRCLSTLSRYLLRQGWDIHVCLEHECPILFCEVSPFREPVQLVLTDGRAVFLSRYRTRYSDRAPLHTQIPSRLDTVSDEHNVFTRTALWVEDDQILRGSWIEPNDTSLSEIRDVISGGEGSAYLGDDVWI